jgi:hypothetical protein
MKGKLIEYYKDLPQWAKGVVVVGGIGILYVTLSQIIRRVRQNAESKFDLQESNSAKSDLEKLAQQGIRPTLSDSQIDNIINSLVESMNDCGTDEDGVYEQFKKLNNLADVYLLLKRWEIRYYRPCAATSPISYSRYLFNDKAFGGNLSTWLTYDLGTSEIKQINKILSYKGINFQF